VSSFVPPRLSVVLTLAILAVVGCSRTSGSAADAGTAAGDASSAASGGVSGFDALAVARAEDLRRAKDLPPDVQSSHDVAARRDSARALSRIADAASVEGLVAHLADEDAEVVTWAAYGLGHACKGREDATVKMLSARAATLGGDAGSSVAPRAKAAGRGSAELEPRSAIARAIGRCGGGLAERALVSLLEFGGAWREPALLGLGDLARSRKQIGADAMTALLEVASPRAGATGGHAPGAAAAQAGPADLAFYALSRADAGEAFGKRVAQAASSALARPGDSRILAIKTLGRAGKDLAKDVVPQVLAAVTDPQHYTPAERAEAARALGALGEPGQSAASDALARLVPDNDAVAIQGLLGPEFHVLYTLIGSLGAEPPKKAEPALRALSQIKAASEPSPALGRRLAELRCAAALGLARGVYDADVLRKCDVETSEISQRVRLTSLLRRPLTGERKAAFRAFAKSDNLRIREQAVEAIADHHELGDAAAAILADALASKKAGLVATAADVLDQHPDRAMVLAESERRAALDPHAPPPTSDPAQELSRDVARALTAALAEKWPEDRFETRIALIEAAASVRHPQAKAVASAACNDPNVVVRERAQKALRTLGENVAACEGPSREPRPAAELGKTMRTSQKVVFTTDADVGPLAFVLEPELSPITATRIAALVRSGFYKGIVVHRVAPGFVVQFGDPEGDGYGGSGTSLRCETSPAPFAALDVGMALAGRDTGSSQVFVTLARTPHLDGEYTRVGRAEGAWWSVAQGDIITDAKLVE
jgi:cyclophilin family peptidyl-prolyl cis-trans isomerase